MRLGQGHDRAAHVARVQMHLGDVIQLDVEDLPDARSTRALARGSQVLDLHQRHVAADRRSGPLQLSRRRAGAGRLQVHRGDDLKKGVPDREHRVRQAEMSDAGVAVWLSKIKLVA